MFVPQQDNVSSHTTKTQEHPEEGDAKLKVST